MPSERSAAYKCDDECREKGGCSGHCAETPDRDAADDQEHRESVEDLYEAAVEGGVLPAAIAQEVVAGWRQGRPVLDSLGDEQIVVADALDALTEAIREIVDAGEALTRPGSQGQEHVNGVRMTNAVQAGAKLIGHKTGIFPELAS